MTKIIIWGVLFFGISCSKAQTQIKKESQHIGGIEVDYQELVKKVEQLRDREFESKIPELKIVTRFSKGKELSNELQNEFKFLGKIFKLREDFRANGLGSQWGSSTRYFPLLNRIEYLPSIPKSSKSKTHDSNMIMLALSEALDFQHRRLPAPKSVDAFLAWEIISLSSGAMMLAGNALKEKHKIEVHRIAKRPDFWFKDEVLMSYLQRSTIFRNALVFGASNFRSNGWSGVEYGVMNGPTYTAAIKRADKWLAGEGLGIWNLPSSKIKGEYKKIQEGRIGPVYLEAWLEDAQSILSFYLSDHYRGYHSGDQVAFEWVSMWETPTVASLVVQVFKARFDKQYDQRKGKLEAHPKTKPSNFESRVLDIIQNGNMVSVIWADRVGGVDGVDGGGEIGEIDQQAMHSQLMKSTLKFPSEEKPFLTFKPISSDKLLHMKSVQSGLDAPGVLLNESILKKWELNKPKHGIWWYATLGKRAFIQCNVELVGIETDFASPDFGKHWMKKFETTMVNVTSTEIKKIEWNAKPAWEISLLGKRSTTDEVHRIRARQFKFGEYLITLSLVSNPTEKESGIDFDQLLKNAKFE